MTGHDVPLGAGETGLAAAVAGVAVAPVSVGLVELAGLELPVLLEVVGVAEAVSELGVDEVEPLAAELVPLLELSVELVEEAAVEDELLVVPLVELAPVLLVLELAAALVAEVVAVPLPDGETPGSGMTTVGITGSSIGTDEVLPELREL